MSAAPSQPRRDPEVSIRALGDSPENVEKLGEILIEVVAHGGSVSFLHPLAPEQARSYWKTALEAADRGERIVLGAWDGDLLAGTVTVLLETPQNQPHRGEIAKMMTRVSHRGRGIATALLQTAEKLAEDRGKTLLILDTAVDGGASGLYESVGYSLCGTIPDFALKPLGGLTGTKFYWKRIGALAGAQRSST